MRHSHPIAAVLFVLGLLVLAPGAAFAGACPMCTTAADCTTPGSFCVHWATSPGCGTVTQICCPGQGCNVGSDGRPSCEASGACTVVDGPLGGTDAGVDASTGVDAGTDVMASSDAGAGTDVSTTSDAATNDAASADAGTTTQPTGCGCSTPGRNHGANGLAAFALVALAFVGRRRASHT